MAFPELIAAKNAGRRVFKAKLYEADFASGFWRGWESSGPLRTSDAKAWIGTGGVISIDGLTQTINGEAPTQRVTVSGIDPVWIEKINASTDEYYMRPFRVFLQWFDDDWQTLDEPFALTLRLMANLVTDFYTDEELGQIHTITLENEPVFWSQALPPFGWLNDSFQNMLFPGDRGLERMADIDNKLIDFPN